MSATGDAIRPESRVESARELVPALVARTATVQEAIAHLEQPECAGVVVVGEDSRLLGTVEMADIRRSIVQGVAFDASVEDVMRPAPVGLMGARDFGPAAVGGLFGFGAHDARTEAAKVVILAGGEGRRLRPLTDTVPKPLLPVGGRPLLETTVRRLVRLGFTDVSLAVLYRADMIEHHFGDGSSVGARVSYVHESVPLGTAGAVRTAAGDDPSVTLVMNGDILTTLRFAEMLQHHRRRKNACTVAMKVMEVAIPYGVLELDDVDITAIREKPVKRFFVNAGIYVLEPEAVDLIPFNRRFDMTDVISTAISKGMRVGGFPIVEYWTDIGQVDDYKTANLDYAQHFESWDRFWAVPQEKAP